MKNKISQAVYIILLTAISISAALQSCTKSDCSYNEGNSPIGEGCKMTDSLNISTGIDTSGNLIPAAKGAVDPFWRLINRPPLQTQSSPLIPTINGNAYVMSWYAPGWAHQPECGVIAPADLGINGSFGDNNAVNEEGLAVPYVFERPFCVLKDTRVNFKFTSKADDSAYYELVNNNTNAILISGYGAVLSSLMTWTASNFSLTAGSYSIRAYLINTGSVILGFSFKGSLEAVNSNGEKEQALSNNSDGCCENNTISILNILEDNCNGEYDNIDRVGPGWTFTVKQGSTVIRTGTTDINGNIFFSGLDDGTYEVEITSQSGYTSSPSSTSVTLGNNEVKLIEFFNCKQDRN